MDKKNLIIMGAVGCAVGAYLLTRDKSVSEMVESIEGTIAGKTAKDQQDSMSATVMSAEDTAYNVARQQYYSAAGKYPPESWTIEQIQEAVSNWTKIRNYLTSYSQYMGKMDRLDESKKNIASCYDLATAEQLATGAKEEYQVYQQKQTIYNRIVKVCNQYGISAADLGISNYATSSLTALQNAETKANQLGSLKARYTELNDLCQATNQQISKYIGSTKWYNVLLSTYDSAIASIKPIYQSLVQSQAHESAVAVWSNLNPYRYDKVGLAQFRDRPYESANTLNAELFKDAINFCAKSSYHLECWKAAFKAEHQDYPVFRCQAKANWPWFDTLSDLMVAGINHSGGATHLTARDNWGELEKVYNQHKAPLWSV